jgi:hypothetical protein
VIELPTTWVQTRSFAATRPDDGPASPPASVAPPSSPASPAPPELLPLDPPDPLPDDPPEPPPLPLLAPLLVDELPLDEPLPAPDEPDDEPVPDELPLPDPLDDPPAAGAVLSPQPASAPTHVAIAAAARSLRSLVIAVTVRMVRPPQQGQCLAFIRKAPSFVSSASVGRRQSLRGEASAFA